MLELTPGSPLGKGFWHAAGSVTEASLLSALQNYRRRVVGAYRSVKPDEMSLGIVGAPFYVSPKIDGELWFLVLEAGQAVLVSTNGKAISGEIALLTEVLPAAQLPGRVVIAGELFAASSGSGRPRVGDVASSLAGGARAQVERLGFAAFDLVEGLIESPLFAPYEARLSALSGLLDFDKTPNRRTRLVKTDTLDNLGALPSLFHDLVEGGKAEGLVVRSALGSIYKIKPEFSVDAVIIGYTARTEDAAAVRTLLLGLTREDGRIQISGHCGNLGGDDERRALMAQLQPLDCPSAFRCPSRSGEMFTFIRPERVAEIKATDLQPETGDGQPVRTMVLDYRAESGWSAVKTMPSASLLHPVLLRLRDDKTPGVIDTRFAQILERCQVDEAAGEVQGIKLPASEILRREVWTKTTQGKIAVRKLLAWKTNKETLDPSYPAYVLHWTDYSSGRATPLDREVRTAPDAAEMDKIAARMIEENIKKGWEKISSSREDFPAG